MQSRHSSFPLAIVTVVIASFAACTQSYSQFVVGDTASSGSSTTSSGGGIGGATTSTTSTGGVAGATGTGGLGGTGGEGGTGGTTCGPCNLSHAQPKCEGLNCAIASCDPGFGDCNMTAGDGCETPVTGDVANCGACARICDPTGTSAVICAAGVCSSTCDLGRANCTKPATGPDDGCELDVSADSANCGGCGNRCDVQGFGTHFVCSNLACRCTSSAECKGAGVVSATCDATSGLCTCGTTACRPGEACIKSGASTVCSCNGASACQAGFTCCQTPSGCKDLSTDNANCGACGHACGPGKTCTGGVCG